MAIANDVDIRATTVVVGCTTFLTQWQLMKGISKVTGHNCFIAVTWRWHEEKWRTLACR